MGNEPTGRKMRTPVFDSLRVKDGKIVEHWGVPHRLYALIQLGLVRPRRLAPQPDREPCDGGVRSRPHCTAPLPFTTSSTRAPACARSA